MAKPLKKMKKKMIKDISQAHMKNSISLHKLANHATGNAMSRQGW